MARLPTSDQLGKRQFQDRSSIVQTSFDSSGQQSLVKTISNISERVQRSAVHKAKMDFQKSKLEIDNSFNNDKDFETYETRYNEKVGKAQESALKSVHSPRMRSELTDEFELYQQRGALTIKAKAFDREVKVGLANLDEVLTTGRENYLMATSKQDKEFIRDTMLDAIQDAHEVGYVDDTQAKNMHQSAAKDLAIAQLATETPANQLQLLQGDSDIAKVVPADVRARMTEQAKAKLRQARNETNIKTNEVLSEAKASSLSFARGGYAEAANEDLQKVNEAIDARVSAGIISGEEAKVQKTQAKREVDEETLTGGLLRTFDEDGYNAALSELDDLSDMTPKGYSPEEWDSYISGAQSDIGRKYARQEKLTKGRAKQIKKEIDFAAIEKRRAGDDSQIIDPGSADAYYKEVLVPEMEGLEPEVRRSEQAQYMDRIKFIPNSIMKEITNAANSNNPNLISEAAQLVDRIDEIPGVVNQIPNTEQAYLMNVVSLMGNMTSAEAIDLSRKATDPKDKARIEAVESRIKEMKKDSPGIYADRAKEAFSTWGFDPVIDEVNAAQMSKEYGVMFENILKAGTINESDAFDKVDKFIKRNWGEDTTFGTRRVMKYPLNVHYPLGGPWIRSQAVTYVSESMAGGGIVRAEDIVLMSNEETARTASTGRPTYAVKVLVDGSFIPIGQWAPDMAVEEDRIRSRNESMAIEERLKNINLNLDLSKIGRAL